MSKSPSSRSTEEEIEYKGPEKRVCGRVNAQHSIENRVIQEKNDPVCENFAGGQKIQQDDNFKA